MIAERCLAFGASTPWKRIRCSYAMTVNEVTRLTPAEFEERRVRQILPDWAPGLLGTHTWNETSRWQVIDGLRF